VARILNEAIRKNVDRLICVINLGEIIYLTQRRFGEEKKDGAPRMGGWRAQENAFETPLLLQLDAVDEKLRLDAPNDINALNESNQSNQLN
jgi:hypothetical protein